VFETPICCQPGDRFIVRNAQATRTVGGGRVLDPFAPARKRRAPARRAWLEALTGLLEHGELQALLDAAPYGLSRPLAMHLSGMPADRLNLPAGTLTLGEGPDAKLILATHWDALGASIVDALRVFHERAPDELGPDSARLRRIVAPLLPESVWREQLDALLARDALRRSGPWLHLSGHAPILGDAERALADALLPRLAAGGFDPPWVRELAALNSVKEDVVREILRKLARQGELYQVVRDLFYCRDAVGELAAIVASLAAQRQQGGVSTATFRDASRLGRKRAIQVLEFFDRVGYTRFHRDQRWLRSDSHLAEHWSCQ
jgi:selenocysteine-specific elongation factor